MDFSKWAAVIGAIIGLIGLFVTNFGPHSNLKRDLEILKNLPENDPNREAWNIRIQRDIIKSTIAKNAPFSQRLWAVLAMGVIVNGICILILSVLNIDSYDWISIVTFIFAFIFTFTIFTVNIISVPNRLWNSILEIRENEKLMREKEVALVAEATSLQIKQWKIKKKKDAPGVKRRGWEFWKKRPSQTTSSAAEAVAPTGKEDAKPLGQGSSSSTEGDAKEVSA